MATSIGQYAPVFLPGEPPSLTEKPGRPQSTGSQRVRHDQSDFVHIDARRFCLWQLCPSESWAWKWCSCLACGDPGGTKCAGTRTASVTGVTALSVFFQASFNWLSEGLFGQSFSVAPPFEALRVFPFLESFSVVQRVRHIEGPPLAGILLCKLVGQTLKRVSWVGSYSVVQCIRRLMGQPVYCSAAYAHKWRERGYDAGSTPYTWLSSIAFLPWLPNFPLQAFPPTIFSLTSPWLVSLQSTAALALGFLHSP